MKIQVELEVPERSKDGTLRALKLIEAGAQRDPIFLKGFVKYMEATLQVKTETRKEQLKDF